MRKGAKGRERGTGSEKDRGNELDRGLVRTFSSCAREKKEERERQRSDEKT